MQVKLDVVDRSTWILGHLDPGARVLHVGCTDWPFTQLRLDNRQLLHDSILDCHVELIGLDNSTEGLALVQSARPDANLVNRDVTDDCSDLGEFDVIVLGEVLEHIGDAESALMSLRTVLRPGGKLLVTVPNALAIKAALRALSAREVVHQDHVSYYSPCVLGQLADRLDLEVRHMAQYLSESVRPVSRGGNKAIRGWISMSGAPIADGLVAELTREK
ncbi:class I SAM-dependent methyltransferase [Ilumatobacter sp.]|uniref:class I SAM-dependent methyltransferase n=1 Tax=Ilumatobacter sp. TaxID=1967498 RepID=UPI003751F4D2